MARFSTLLLAAFVCGCGDSSLECGDGTHEEDGACVADEGVTDGADGATDGSDGGTDGADGATDGADGGDGGDGAVDGSDGTAGDDFDVCGDGSAPYTDLQEAIDAASDGDVLRVCAGIWDPVDLSGRTLTIRGTGSDDTVIDGGSMPAVTLSSGDITLQGLQLTGEPGEQGTAAVLATGGEVSLSEVAVRGAEAAPGQIGTRAMTVENATLEMTDSVFEDNALQNGVYSTEGGTLLIRNTVFRGNTPPGGANGGILVLVSRGDLELSNSLFTDNYMNFSAELVNFGISGGTAWVFNNTIAGNTNDWDGYGILSAEGTAEVLNNIVAQNSSKGIYATEGVTLAYNDAWGNDGDNYYGTAGVDDSNMERDPKFVDLDGGDLTLDPGFSPCIDAGSPESGYNDPDGSRNDMGAYGGPGGNW